MSKLDILTVTAERLSVETVTLDPAIEKRYDDARAYLVFRWSFFSQIIYDGMEIVFVADGRGIPIAATDSHSIFINHEGFERAGITDVLEIVFVKAHEVTHRVLYDVELATIWHETGVVRVSNGVDLPYDDELMNAAMDYRINAMLVHSGIGKMPKVGLYDPAISAQGMESCVEIYEKLWNNATKIKINIRGLGFDKHLRPSRAQVKKDAGKREQGIIAAAQLQERLKQGSLPGALKRQLGDILEPKVKWENHLRTIMTRKAGDKISDWAKRDRRLAGRNPEQFYAGIRHRGAGPIVGIGDNSGSIMEKVTNIFAGEFAGIVADLRPSRFIAMWCDTAVTRVDELEEPDDLTELFAKWKKEGVGGGGGTDFRPAFDEIAKRDIVPDMVVFFTDGHGTFPAQAPDYPVVWGMTTNVHPPFGEVVRVKI